METPTPKQARTRRDAEGRTGGRGQEARTGWLRTTVLAILAGRFRLLAVAAAVVAAVTTVHTAASLISPPLVVHEHDHVPRTPPALPYYLGGRPENFQNRSYGADVPVMPHVAYGPGLNQASTGVPASFKIRLAGSGGGDGRDKEESERSAATVTRAAAAGERDNGSGDEEGKENNPGGGWDYNVRKAHFVYVWIASEDSVFVAAVENNGDGTLTATYEAPFPGSYLVHIEDVDLGVKEKFDKGRPIIGSPFSLTVTGDPAVRVDDLPVCGTTTAVAATATGGMPLTVDDRVNGDTQVGKENGGGGSYDLASEYWRTGSWVSSNIASPEHGVLRDGWVFQPRDCAYEAFSYEDLMLLARRDKPTWIVALGNSILRGVFLTLVDMALAEGQKDEFSTSVLTKCWGFSDVRIGNLRLTYQDLRLYTVLTVEDATVCNDEKLASGSTAAYVSSAELFLKETIFREDDERGTQKGEGRGRTWPTVVFAPSNMVDDDEAPNLQIDVLLDALPTSWTGKLVMLDHLYAFNYGWNTWNPTMATMSGVKPVNEFSPRTPDSGVGRMNRYHERDPRISFLSAFPIYQARLFENEESRPGKRCYGCSIHYHYVSDSPSSPEAYGGAKMVHSAVTETLANIMIAKVVGTKAALYETTAVTPAAAAAAAAAAAGAGAAAADSEERLAEMSKSFELCTDCPASLVPLHIKPVPAATCNTTRSLPGNAPVGSAWDNELCPDWCMAVEPDRQASKGSGLVDVRVCGGTSHVGVGGGSSGDRGDGRKLRSS